MSAQSLSMYTAFLKRFGEDLEKMFQEFFLMPAFQIQTEAAQIWLWVFIVLVSGPSTYQTQYHSIILCNDNFFKKSRFLHVEVGNTDRIWKLENSNGKIKENFLHDLKPMNSFV